MKFLTEPLGFKSSLTPEFLRQAKAFRREQKNAQKARQVYLNTLAVQAVHFYCTCIGVETDLMASDSWNAAMRTLMDVADLVVKGKGKLECRPVLPGDEVCSVPPETLEDRIGYVVVEIHEETYEAKLLGFSRAAEEGRLPIKQMPPLDDLIEAIVDDVPETEPALSSAQLIETNLVKLEQWFRGIFDEFWQDSGLVLAAAYRGSIRDQETGSPERVKFLDVGNHKVALVVKVTQIADAKRDILLRVFPSDGNILPPDLLLQLLDDAGDVAMREQAGDADNFKALNFRIGIEEVFNVKITLEDVSVSVPFLS
jgi:hypothetical protein